MLTVCQGVMLTVCQGVMLTLCQVLTPSLPQPVNFRAERCTDAPADSVFSGPITSFFNAMRFDEDPFTCHCEKEDRKKTLKGFKFCALIGRFQVTPWQ